MTLLGDKMYAWCGEDVVAACIFEQLGISAPSYLDVGAKHPLYMSNTALLYARGSTGINIDADSANIAELKRGRPRDITLHCAIGPVSGTFPLYFHERGLVSLKVWNDLKVLDTREVEVKTLHDILRTHNSGLFPDLLSIDIEGMDYEVLDSTDLEETYPLVIVAEAHKGTPEAANIRHLLEDSGFFFLMRCSHDVVFVHSSVRERLF